MTDVPDPTEEPTVTEPEGDWPPPLPADVNLDDVDAAALWQKWIDEEPAEGN